MFSSSFSRSSHIVIFILKTSFQTGVQSVNKEHFNSKYIILFIIIPHISGFVIIQKYDFYFFVNLQKRMTETGIITTPKPSFYANYIFKAKYPVCTVGVHYSDSIICAAKNQHQYQISESVTEKTNSEQIFNTARRILFRYSNI